MNLQTANFGAGCFWGIEAAFRQVKGVKDTAVGYMGGNLDNPTYEDVCSGKTDHTEVVRIRFDISEVSYKDLLDVFWKSHCPTQLNRQGADVGTQYRSAVFYENDEQRELAKHSKEELSQSGKYTESIVTAIEEAGKFNKAEEYHQQYLEKRGQARCHMDLKI